MCVLPHVLQRIRHTGRTLEHISSVAEHAIDSMHVINWEEMQVMDSHPHVYRLMAQVIINGHSKNSMKAPQLQASTHYHVSKLLPKTTCAVTQTKVQCK